MIYYNYLGQAMPESASPTSDLYGTNANGQTLQAPAGDILIEPGTGSGDVMIGGAGDDTFIQNDPSDVIQVAAGLGGTDTVVTYTGYALPANVQNLTSYASYGEAAGNSGNNLIIVGNNDGVTLYGDGGADVLVGGLGHDTFLVPADSGSDVIYNFNSVDTVRLPGTSFGTFAQVAAAMTQVGPDVVLQVDPNDTLTFRNMTISQFTPSNFLLQFDPSVLGALTFDDEFTSLDTWNPSTQTGQWLTNFNQGKNNPNSYSIVSNGEQEAYTDANFQGTAAGPLGLNPFTINPGGGLTITAAPIPAADLGYTFGQSFSSGMLNTKGIFEQEYGYFEINAEMPQTAGSWPAFWMVPDTYNGQEADITEDRGSDPQYDYVRAYSAGGAPVYANAIKSGDPSGFHTYGLLWTPTTLTYTYDGYVVLTTPTPSSWTGPMYMILDLAMGGWGGQPTASSTSMTVDWVRAYALADGSSIVEHGTPPPTPGTIQAADSATVLANAGAWTDAEMLANGSIALTAAQDDGWGSHVGVADLYDSGTGAQIGNQIGLLGYSPIGAVMDPSITQLTGGYWEVSYSGAGAPQGFEVYNAAGQLAFVDNQYNQGEPVFTPMADSGWVVSNSAWGRFAVTQPSGRVDWFNEDLVGGVATAPTQVVPLSTSGFVFTYQGSTQLDVYDLNGNHVSTSQLGAANSNFAIDAGALPNGDFGIAWLAPPAAGSSNWELEFQTFTSAGAPITAATGVAVDGDPWHTEIQVIATGQTDQALLLWSQGGAVWGVTATGASVGTPTPLIVGALDQVKETALSNGDVALTWLQTSNGVQDLWAEVLNPATMKGTQEELGAADGNVHLVALPQGAFAVSWHSGGQIYAEAYDGVGDYGNVIPVSGDFLGLDSSGQIVAVGANASGAAVLQHYAVTLVGG